MTVHTGTGILNLHVTVFKLPLSAFKWRPRRRRARRRAGVGIDNRSRYSDMVTYSDSVEIIVNILIA